MPSKDELTNRLDMLDATIRQCNSCPEREQFPGTLPTIQFQGQNGILFIGRDPAKNGWRKSGRAFYKPDGSLLSSGKIFKDQLEDVGIHIEDINFVELIKCFPSGGRMRNPRKSEIYNCGQWLNRQVDILRPKVIVPMGKECFEFFRGKRVSSFSSCVERGERAFYRGIPVVSLFHPSGANQKYNWMNKDLLRRIVEEFGGE